MNIVIYFDGACEPHNPGGTGTWGFVVKGLDGDISNWGSLKAHPQMTNNYAEYMALGKAVRWLVDQHLPLTKDDELLIQGDSKLVIEQLVGHWACRAERLKPLLFRCRELLGKLPCPWKVEWIPREQNEEADALSQKAYIEATGKPFPVRERRK